MVWTFSARLWAAVKSTYCAPLDTFPGNPIDSLLRALGVATDADAASTSPCDLPETYGHKLLWVLMGVNAQRSGYGAVKACNLFVSSHVPRQHHYLTLQTFKQIPSLLKYLPAISRTLMGYPYIVWASPVQ